MSVMNITRKEVRRMVLDGVAKDITNITVEEIQNIKQEEESLRPIAIAYGEAGPIAAVCIGQKSGTLYGVAERTFNIISVLA